jgi:two-component system, chemotaxis family, response regulator Rcp1
MRQVRIVLVEDHAPDVFLVQKALRDNNLDFQLTRYEDGEEALRELSKRGPDALEIPDVVILDLNVPKIDGMGILRAIRTNPVLGRVPIAVLTSSRAANDRLDAIASGADLFITKPIDLQSFVRIVGGNIKELIEERSHRSGTNGA